MKKLVVKTKLKNTFHTYELRGKKILKQTYWIEMKTDFNKKLKPQHSEDIEIAVWVSPEKLDKKLRNTYRNIIEVLEQFGKR